MVEREFDAVFELRKIVEKVIENAYFEEGELYIGGKKFESCYPCMDVFDSYKKLMILKTLEGVYEVLDEMPKQVFVDDVIEYLEENVEIYDPINFRQLRKWADNVENIKYVDNALKLNIYRTFYELLRCAYELEKEEVKKEIFQCLRERLEFEQYKGLIIEC